MNLLLFLILESLSMIIVLICCKTMTIIFSKKVSNFIFVQIVSYCIREKKIQEILYTAMLDYLLWYIKLKSGWNWFLVWTVAYSFDLNLRTNYFSIVSCCHYAWETHHSRPDSGKVCETWSDKFASIHCFNSHIAMLHIDETPVKVGI